MRHIPPLGKDRASAYSGGMCCLQNSTLHSVRAAQLLSLCPNGALMTTASCSPQWGHRGRKRLDSPFALVDGCVKETEDIQLIKTKIVMRERGNEAQGGEMRWSGWLWRGVKYDGGRVPGGEERHGGSWEVKRQRMKNRRDEKEILSIHKNLTVCEEMYRAPHSLANKLHRFRTNAALTLLSFIERKRRAAFWCGDEAQPRWLFEAGGTI